MEDPRAFGGRLHALLDAHCRRLNAKPFPYEERFLEVLKARLGDRLTLYVASAGEEPVGVQLMFRDEHAAYLPMVGIDAVRGKSGAVYHNLGYNNPIRECIAAGDRRIYCGKLDGFAYPPLVFLLRTCKCQAMAASNRAMRMLIARARRFVFRMPS